MPDLETNVMTPPCAWPYSALNPFVSTVNSVMASTDGALVATQLMSWVEVSAAETPSSVIPQAAPWPPPRTKP